MSLRCLGTRHRGRALGRSRRALNMPQRFSEALSRDGEHRESPTNRRLLAFCTQLQNETHAAAADGRSEHAYCCSVAGGSGGGTNEGLPLASVMVAAPRIVRASAQARRRCFIAPTSMNDVDGNTRRSQQICREHATATLDYAKTYGLAVDLRCNTSEKKATPTQPFGCRPNLPRDVVREVSGLTCGSCRIESWPFLAPEPTARWALAVVPRPARDHHDRVLQPAVWAWRARLSWRVVVGPIGKIHSPYTPGC